MASSNNQINVPQASEAMDKFKMQAASEVGVNPKQGYSGDLTSREAGSVSGQMVKKDKSHTKYEFSQKQPDFYRPYSTGELPSPLCDIEAVEWKQGIPGELIVDHHPGCISIILYQCIIIAFAIITA